jgi:hypothetical protein
MPRYSPHIPVLPHLLVTQFSTLITRRRFRKPQTRQQHKRHNSNLSFKLRTIPIEHILESVWIHSKILGITTSRLCNIEGYCQWSNCKVNNSMALVSERTILTEWPPPVGKDSADFSWYRGGGGCRVVSAADPQGRNLDFIDCSRYSFFKIAPQLYSRGWVDPVPEPLFLRKSGTAGNRTRTCGSVARNSDN